MHYANDLFCSLCVAWLLWIIVISTPIILSLYARHNYNHLPHNYNFKTLYQGASFWQRNNWWAGNGDVCIPGMAKLDERRMVPLSFSITNITTYVQSKTRLFQTAQLLSNAETFSRDKQYIWSVRRFLCFMLRNLCAVCHKILDANWTVLLISTKWECCAILWLKIYLN